MDSEVVVHRATGVGTSCLTRRRPPAWWDIALLTAVSVFVANMVTSLPQLMGYATVAVVGVAVGCLFRGTDPGTWLLAAIPASVAVGSPLVPGVLCYAPAGAVAAAALVAWFAQRPRVPITLRWPTNAVRASAAVYLSWMLVASLVSSDRPSAVAAAAGSAFVVGGLLVIAPTVLARREADVLRTIIGTTTVLASSSFLLWATGPVQVFGREIGRYVPNELVWRGDLTGIVVPRATGVFGAPGYQGLAVMCGLVVLTAMRPASNARGLWWIRVGIVVHVLALTLSMSRGGWLGAVVGVSFILLIDVAPRPRIAPVLILTTLTALLLVVSFSTLGTVVRAGSAATGPDLGSDLRLSRGGLQLTSRHLLWDGSLEAIQAKPVFGSGPGRNAAAIAPYVPGTHYDQLGSHNTVLRVAVETGLPGAAAFVTFLVVGLTTLVKRTRQRLDGGKYAALTALAMAITVSSMTETLLFGGLALPSLLWGASVGLVAGGATPDQP